MRFSYRVRTKENRTIQGFVESPDEATAADLLQQRGYIILELAPEKSGVFARDLNQLFSKPKTKDVVAFTRQLSTLVEAQVPLAQAIRTLAQQTEKLSFAKIITDVADEIEGGSSISEAFGKFPGLFSAFFVKIVKAGEISGRLKDSLLYLADYLERSQAITSKVKNALAYPAFIIFAMVLVSGIMTVYVLPQLLVIFEEQGVEALPITTRALIFVTDLVNDYLIFWVVGAVILIVGLIQWARTADGKKTIGIYQIQVPLFGKILRNLYLARIAENMSTLIKSDIAILDALRVTADIVDNPVYSGILLDAEENVRGGGLISDTFRKYEEMPPLITSMVAIGEQTGKMETMLGHVSTFYRTEADNSIATISTLIEPILVLTLGAGVAILVSSILLPIYSLVSVG